MLFLLIDLRWYLALAIILMVMMGMHSPAALLTQLLTSQYLNLVVDSLAGWQDHLSSLQSGGISLHELQTSSVFKIIDIIHYYNDHFGPLLLCDMATCFIVQIFTYFFLFFCYSLVEGFSLGRMYFFIGTAFMQASFAFRAYHLGTLGSRLGQELEKASRQLRHFRRANFKDEDEGRKFILDSLEVELEVPELESQGDSERVKEVLSELKLEEEEAEKQKGVKFELRLCLSL